MARLRRAASSALSGDGALRLRAAWLYHGYGLTQNEVADQLGIGRSTVIRLLEEARLRGEVKVSIEEGPTELVDLSIQLERRLGLDEAVVVPAPAEAEGTAAAVGMALGRFLSDTVDDGMTVGVGWGRTLGASLGSLTPAKREGVRVMSLMGGSVETSQANPFEFAWRLANALQAECYLFPAPLIVDSAETRQRLMRDCGLDRLIAMAGSLDIAVVSAGDIANRAGSLVRGFISEDDITRLIAEGAVADIMCNVIDEAGVPLPDPVNDRVMSVGTSVLKSARHIVLAGGGKGRGRAILSVIRCIGCNTLITDEHAARAMLERLD